MTTVRAHTRSPALDTAKAHVRKPVRLMECYRARMFRETTERLRGFVDAKRMRDLNDHYSDMLAAALELELASADFRRLTETW